MEHSEIGRVDGVFGQLLDCDTPRNADREKSDRKNNEFPE